MGLSSAMMVLNDARLAKCFRSFRNVTLRLVSFRPTPTASEKPHGGERVALAALLSESYVQVTEWVVNADNSLSRPPRRG